MITPYLYVENAKEAIQFYKNIFNLETPKEVYYENDSSKLLHATLTKKCLKTGESQEFLFLTELFKKVTQIGTMAASKTVIGNNINLHIRFEDRDSQDKAFNKLKESGVEILKLQETHWGDYFGSVRDKYGIIWQFNGPESTVTP